MKWLSAKYAYPLVVVSVLASIILQVIWLQQLFNGQRSQAKQQIEQIVNNAARDNMYNSLKKLGLTDTLLTPFFKGAEWGLIRSGFDAVKAPHMYKSFEISDTNKDSTYVAFKFVFINPESDIKRRKPGQTSSDPYSPQADSVSIREMHALVTKGLAEMGLKKGFYYGLYAYNAATPKNGADTAAEYTSAKYTYNMAYMHKYQLIIPSLERYIWYTMRYYILSVVLMLVLTCAAFYFIIRLMRNQRLYADARVAFTSNMTHELKTPIATVSLALESITRYGLIHQPEKLEEYLSIGRQELQRLNLMIEKVLNLSREEEGAYPLNKVLFDVQTGLQDVVRSMELQLTNAGAVCRLQLSPEPCFVDGDPVHLTNVFYNLVENAIKYADRPLELEISCAAVNDRVILHVKDNGPGIDKLYHDKIFDRFFRVPAKGDTHDVKGSGLGLNYVKTIIEHHDGTVTLKSEPGKGSDFIINLPAAV